MKILVVQLLRVGDLFMTSPIISAISAKYPDANIDLLINKESQAAAKLLSNINQIFVFDRKNVQTSLLDINASTFEAYDILDRLCQDLNNESYDLVLNLTHNRFSAYICAAIEANKHLGPNALIPSTSSQWLSYMEDSYITRSQVFHFVDCFAKSFGIQDFIFNDSLENIGAAKDILQQYHLSAKQYTCFQLCTSDTKKELSAQQNIDLLEHFMNINTDTQVVVLCAPNEVDKLKYIVDYFESGHNGDNHNSNLSLISCTFAEAYALLKNAKGLFSLDTSIKHLAANIATPIVELAIGSSNPYETAAYSENNLVLQANLACHPCSHSSACSKQSHECALNLDIKSVAEISTAYFNQNKKEMQSIASRSASTMHSYMTQFDFYQNLSFIPLAAHLVDSFILKEIEKISIQYLLNDKQNKNFSITEQISFIYEQSRALAGDLKLRSFRAKLEEYLNDMMLLETSSLRLLDSIEESKSLALETSMHDWWSGLNLDTVSVKGIWSTRLSDIKIEQNSFKRFRRLHNLVKDVSQSLGFKKKAIRTLLSEMESVVL